VRVFLRYRGHVPSNSSPRLETALFRLVALSDDLAVDDGVDGVSLRPRRSGEPGTDPHFHVGFSHKRNVRRTAPSDDACMKAFLESTPPSV